MNSDKLGKGGLIGAIVNEHQIEEANSMPSIEDETIKDNAAQKERMATFKAQISQAKEDLEIEPLGTLVLTVVRGRLTRDTEILGEMDPYV